MMRSFVVPTRLRRSFNSSNVPSPCVSATSGGAWLAAQPVDRSVMRLQSSAETCRSFPLTLESTAPLKAGACVSSGSAHAESKRSHHSKMLTTGLFGCEAGATLPSGFARAKKRGMLQGCRRKSG